jgi:hypothetical protein
LANLGSESETCVGSRVHLVGVSISFEKNFYWLPFTPPSLVRRIGPSAGRVRTVRISRCNTSCSGCIFRPSTETSWTIRLNLVDHPPGHRGPSALGIAVCLSPLLLELRFRVALSLGLLLGFVGSD